MIATILLVAGNLFAQDPSVPIPQLSWPIDSVINGMVKSYSVQGDVYYDSVSTFLWRCDGGRLFLDSECTIPANMEDPANDSISSWIKGNSGNISTIYVLWDKPTDPVYNGWLYVSERSADGCEQADTEWSKFKGRIVQVWAPPFVKFIEPQTVVCSDAIRDTSVIIQILGLPPYKLWYTYTVTNVTNPSSNTKIDSMFITDEDLSDLDGDGHRNNIEIPFTNYFDATDDLIYTLELDSAKSDTVKGIIEQYEIHNLYAFQQPVAPHISRNNREVTVDVDKVFELTNEGENYNTHYWYLYDSNWNLRVDTTGIQFNYKFDHEDYVPGTYYLICNYDNEPGCVSLNDTLEFELFGVPVIYFNSDNIEECSEIFFTPENTSLIPRDTLEFEVKFYGARPWEFTYRLTGPDGNLVPGYESVEEKYLSDTIFYISIPHNFVNETTFDQVYTLDILKAENREIDAILYDFIRTITIHPKPIVLDDIDFAD